MTPYSTITFPQNLAAIDLIIDARSEDEYADDHIPGAINLPVLNNEERIEIGTLYKKNAFQASRKGAALISRNVANHLENALADHPHGKNIVVYCARGNLRSRSFAHILGSVGWKVAVVNGGYKHFRNYVISHITHLLEEQSFQFKIISGYTGSGKTHLLKALEDASEQVLDLEDLANHKGSLFGSPAKGSQPSQRQYENLLWQQLSKFTPSKPVYVESESNRIGSVFCPASLWKALKLGEVIDVDLPLNDRVSIIKRDYPHLLENPVFVIDLLDKLVRIRGHEQVNQWKQQVEQGEWDTLISSLLVHHYDIAYKSAGEEGSSYLSPSATVHITDSSAEAYANAAQEIIQ